MNNKWIANTGRCPVLQGTLVDVQYRDGEIRTGLPACMSYPGSRDAALAFWDMDGRENDIAYWRLHESEEVTKDNPSSLGMSANQFDIYTKNFLALTEGLQTVGGNVGAVLRKHTEFLETLARNGLEVKLTVHPNVDN